MSSVFKPIYQLEARGKVLTKIYICLSDKPATNPGLSLSLSVSLSLSLSLSPSLSLEFLFRGIYVVVYGICQDSQSTVLSQYPGIIIGQTAEPTMSNGI
jgi:hypothetical protein